MTLHVAKDRSGNKKPARRCSSLRIPYSREQTMPRIAMNNNISEAAIERDVREIAPARAITAKFSDFRTARIQARIRIFARSAQRFPIFPSLKPVIDADSAFTMMNL